MRKIIILLLGCIIISCNDKGKDIEPSVIADFNYEIDDIDYFKVHFTNLSENAISVSWDFGNGDSSNLENPTYRYASKGMYDVTLTVFGANGTQDSQTQVITLAGIPKSPQEL
ncbi:MAG: PKD domain-containing protein [Bacteroidota bacterium]